MDLFFQLVAALGYLFNKVFFLSAEWLGFRAAKNRLHPPMDVIRRLRIAGWIAYLIGLPAWVILFYSWRNFIAATVEASGLPAMVLGLAYAWRRNNKPLPGWTLALALVATFFGLFWSVWYLGGFGRLTQWLELVTVVGYLAGTYLLAYKRYGGYLWYVAMHIACGWLLWTQGLPWLFAQQVASLLCIIPAYYFASHAPSSPSSSFS